MADEGRTDARSQTDERPRRQDTRAKYVPPKIEVIGNLSLVARKSGGPQEVGHPIWPRRNPGQ
jgi:hypothetical protein